MKKKLAALALALALILSLAAPAFAADAFRDVPEGHWAYAYVERAAEEGWINGMGDGLYAPDETVSYGQFITMLARMFYADETAQSTERDEWWSPYVDTAYYTFAYESGFQTASAETVSELGKEYLAGYVNGPVTRVDMAYMLYRVVEEKAPDLLPTQAEIRQAAQGIPDYSDYHEHWQTQIAGAVAMGLITGVDGAGTFAGSESMTRAQAAAVLCRIYDRVSGRAVQPPEESEQPLETQTPEETQPSMDVSALEQEVFELVNQVRAENGLSPFSYSSELADVARAHSQDMIDRSFFDHTDPDGQSPFDRMEAAGIRYWAAAENIAYGYPTPEAVMEGWMNSPGHRANILSESTTSIGVGLAVSAGGVYYWTQCFADFR